MPGLFAYKLVAYKKEGYIKNIDPCFLFREGCQMLLFHLEKHVLITVLQRDESGSLLYFNIQSHFFVPSRPSYKQLLKNTCQPCKICYIKAYVATTDLKSLR